MTNSLSAKAQATSAPEDEPWEPATLEELMTALQTGQRPSPMPHHPDDASDSEHLPAPVIDHRKAKGQLLAVLHNKDPLLCGAEAARSLAARNRELVNGDGKAIAEALADQVAILEAVSARFTYEALVAKKPEQQKNYASTALKANTSLTQALLALHRVSEDQRNGKAFNG